MIPPELAELIKGYSIEEHPYNETGARIYRLTSVKGTLFLKIRISDQKQRLLREQITLKWLAGRIHTPEVIYYHTTNEISFLLTTEVKGTPIYQIPKKDRQSAIIIAAKTLRNIHKIPIKNCPFNNSLKDRFEKAETLNLSENKKIMLLNLISSAPSETLVFTHGDYCLPNVLVSDSHLGGVIDWDASGVADPYVDLASVAWSIEYNFPEETEKLLNLFLNEYGVEIEENKFDFYLNLAQLLE